MPNIKTPDNPPPKSGASSSAGRRKSTPNESYEVEYLSDKEKTFKEKIKANKGKILAFVVCIIALIVIF